MATIGIKEMKMFENLRKMLINFWNRDADQTRLEAYLSQAKDHSELEKREQDYFRNPSKFRF